MLKIYLSLPFKAPTVITSKFLVDLSVIKTCRSGWGGGRVHGIKDMITRDEFYGYLDKFSPLLQTETSVRLDKEGEFEF